MAFSRVAVEVTGAEEFSRALKRIAPATNPRFLRRAMVKAALAVQDSAASKQIIRSGPKGVTHPSRLTSRHGGAGLVGSIGVDRSELPRAISVGSDKVYAAIHELGLTVDRKSRVVSRKGKSVFVSGHSAKYPPRPFLQPALDDVSGRFAEIFADEWRREVRR